MSHTRSEILFRPFNAEQQRAREAFRTSDILFLLGEAGTGKTHTALGLAATHALSCNCRVVLTRPVVAAAGESLGYLPGKLEQKMHPWLLPLHDVLRRMTFAKPDEWIKENCEVAPLGFMRGRTFDRSVAVLDEAQNASRDQLLMFLTRIGEKGKLIVSGDLAQSDRHDSGLRGVVEALSARQIEGVSVAYLSCDCNPRHPLIPKLISALSTPPRAR